MKEALPWLLFTYVLAPLALFGLLAQLRSAPAADPGAGSGADPGAGPAPDELPELALVALVLPPLLLPWLAILLYALAPQRDPRFYLWGAALLGALAVFPTPRRLRCGQRALILGWGWLRSLDPARGGLLLLALGALGVLLALQLAGAAVLGVVHGSDDALQYAQLARLIFERGEVSFYLFSAADPQSGYFSPMTHPLGFPATFLWGYLIQGHADVVGVGKLVFAWTPCVTALGLVVALRRRSALAQLAAPVLLLGTTYYRHTLQAYSVDPLLGLTVLTLVISLGRAAARPSRIWLALSGVSLGLCLIVHSLGLLALPMALVTWVGLRRRDPWRTLAWRTLALALLALLIGGQQYAENTVERGRPIGDSNPIWELEEIAAEEHFVQTRGLATPRQRVLAYLQVWSRPDRFGPAPWLGLLGVVLLLRRREEHDAGRPAACFLALYFAGVFLLTFPLGGNQIVRNPRYFVFTLPLFALCGAVALESCEAWAARPKAST